jgi:uncharacterized protein
MITGGIVFTILIVYIIISLVVYFLQDFLLFKPEKLPADFKFQYENLDFDEYSLPIKPNVVVNGLHFKSENPRGIVFYLKGNSRSIKGWGKFAVDFVRNRYDVIMIDYRGFGKSRGKRSHEEIKNDLQKIYDLIKERVPERYIILYGRSMGSGFATKLASVNNPRMLILDAPYYSLRHVASRWLPFMPISWILRYPIPTYKWIKYVKCPIRIIHGTNDNLIPFKSSIMLSKINPIHLKLFPIIGGGHNNLHNFPSYHEYLDEILVDKSKSTFDITRSSLNFKRKERI